LNRKAVLSKVDELLETFCKDCFLRRHLRNTYGKTYAQRFCIHQCSVGEELQMYGKMLLNKNE